MTFESRENAIKRAFAVEAERLARESEERNQIDAEGLKAFHKEHDARAQRTKEYFLERDREVQEKLRRSREYVEERIADLIGPNGGVKVGEALTSFKEAQQLVKDAQEDLESYPKSPADLEDLEGWSKGRIELEIKVRGLTALLESRQKHLRQAQQDLTRAREWAWSTLYEKARNAYMARQNEGHAKIADLQAQISEVQHQLDQELGQLLEGIRVFENHRV